MEKNRNIEFSPKIEFSSLKDAVWRLTTRVYLLEDFIAQKFGEELGPDGFTKLAASSPGLLNISQSLRKNGKSRKRGRGSGPETEKESKKVSKPQNQTDVCNKDINIVSKSQLQVLETLDPSEVDEIFTLKDELPINSDLESDCDDDGFNDETEKDNNVNDSVEKDPDFISNADGDCDPQSSYTVIDKNKKEKFEEKVKSVLQNKNHTRGFSAQKYKNVLERLKLLTSGAKRTFNDLNLTRSYKLANTGKEFFIVNKDDKRLVSLDKIYGILEEAHINTKHGGRDTMKRHIDKTFGNITIQHIVIFLQLCEECRSKRETGGRPKKSIEAT